MESAFAVIAEPHRRAILSMLSSSERSVGELMHHLRLPQPSVSKHLKVLREGGFVKSRVEPQRRSIASIPNHSRKSTRVAGAVPPLLVKARRCPGATLGADGEGLICERKEKT